MWVGTSMSRGALGAEAPCTWGPRKKVKRRKKEQKKGKKRKPMSNDSKIYVSPLSKFPFYQKKKNTQTEWPS